MDEFQDILLTTLTYGGDALGRLPDGQAVFVPFGLPGERVRVRLLNPNGRPLRAALVEVLEPSLDRVEPRCIHFGACGGCHYQHMSHAAQQSARREILRDQFRRIGRIESPPVQETVASPEPWNYRNHIQFHLAVDGHLGYVPHPAGPAADVAVLPITECHLPETPLNELWPQLEFEPGTGIQRVSLRAGEESMMIMESDAHEPPEMELEAGISVV
ncbi:MAG TPA: TRAM domain-containing protein, partial [Anaerolineales bacterium]